MWHLSVYSPSIIMGVGKTCYKNYLNLKIINSNPSTQPELKRLHLSTRSIILTIFWSIIWVCRQIFQGLHLVRFIQLRRKKIDMVHSWVENLSVDCRSDVLLSQPITQWVSELHYWTNSFKLCSTSSLKIQCHNLSEMEEDFKILNSYSCYLLTCWLHMVEYFTSEYIIRYIHSKKYPKDIG